MKTVTIEEAWQNLNDRINKCVVELNRHTKQMDFLNDALRRRDEVISALTKEIIEMNKKFNFGELK